MTPEAEAAPPPGDGRVLAAVGWLTASHLRAVAALILLALACYLPGLATIGPVDRDEARFAQASRQMLETGDFVDIRMHDEPRYKKPVGIYWLQAGLVLATGQGADAGIGAFRLASLFGALATVLLLYWAAIPLFGRQAAFIAAAALAVSLVLVAEAHLAKTDAVLAATVVLAQGALARLYLWPGPGRAPLATALLFWAGLGLGMLVKGPVILMVAGFTIAGVVALDRRAAWLRNLRWAAGVPLALAFVLPWLLAILSIAGTEFLKESFGKDLFGKVGGGQEGVALLPGFHFLAFWFVFWPAVVLVPAAVPWVWRNRATPAVRFCLAWIVPTWLVFEIVATKLVHYTLPTYPAIAALAGGAAVAGLASGRLWTRLSAVGPGIFAVVLPAAGIGLLWWFGGTVSLAGIAVALVAAGLAAAAIRAGLRDALLPAAVCLGAAAILGCGYLLAVVAPSLDVIRLSPRLAAAAERAAACPAPAVVAAGYAEASLVFSVGTGIRFADGAGAADFLAGGGCRMALVATRQEQGFRARAAELGLALDERDRLSGFNMGGGRMVEIGVYRLAAPPGADRP